MSRITIVDYGIGNILSVKRAFEKNDCEVILASTQEEIVKATHLILPGVGAFADGMKELHRRNMVRAIQEHCEQNKPFLGICLGMQMMMDESEEFGCHSGLGIIHGRVEPIDKVDIEGNNQKIPHIGWNKLLYTGSEGNSILSTIPEKSEVYFVHSYVAKPKEECNRLADTYYGGRRITAVIKKGKCYGVQFHPEKSGEIGLSIIRNFIKL